MDKIIECIIAGGPQHGQVRRQPIDKQGSEPLIHACGDGHLCIPAARRSAGTVGNRFILLHPRATGQQFMAMLAVLGGHTASA